MSYRIFCKGKVTLSSKKNLTIHAFDGDANFRTTKRNNWDGGENGIFEGNYVAPEKKPSKNAVKEIELLTALDQGSANDGSGGYQKAMIFGKTYQFRVKSYAEEPPTNKERIKWMLKYHSLSEMKWIEIPLPAKGENIKITLNDEDMCGRFVYVRAYVKDKETEGELKIWKHNRFRWFDRAMVEKEIKERTDDNKPWLINQSGTSLCGMACIFYLFAKEQPDAYKKFAKELFRTGEATFNNYTVKPSFEVFEKRVDRLGLPANTLNMPLVDYLTMAGTRNTDNPSYKGGEEEFQAINWPPLMTGLFEKLLGYKNVYSRGIYNPMKPIVYTSLDIKNKIDDINYQLKQGYKLILMIDSDLIDDIWDVSSLDLHWVVLESEIREVQMLNEDGRIDYQLDFSVYTWGTNPFEKGRYLKRPISKQHFMNNYNGYIKCK